MKEAIASAIHTSDLSTKRGEGSTDRLGAMAFGEGIGVSFIWAQLTGESRRFVEVVNSIAEKLESRSKYRFHDRLKVSAIAAFELMFPHCRNCNGAKACKNASGVLEECTKCDGTGMHRFTDFERGRLMGSRFTSNHAKLLSNAQQILTSSESAALFEIKRQLER
jgi:DnaJ-class molecular chaperone